MTSQPTSRGGGIARSYETGRAAKARGAAAARDGYADKHDDPRQAHALFDDEL